MTLCGSLLFYQPLQLLFGIAQLGIDGYALVELFLAAQPRFDPFDLFLLAGDGLGKLNTLFQCQPLGLCGGCSHGLARSCAVADLRDRCDCIICRIGNLALNQGAE